jgi:O-acetyl-ADP-ribose deacetylase (regulator of RNase III)
MNFHEVNRMKREAPIGKGKLYLLQADLTEMQVDAIVNAANTSLVLGGGVAGAIAWKGGPSIQEECDRIGGTQVGGAVITTAGNLKAKKVIHAVGPRMGEGNEDEKLRNATRNSLLVAEKNKLKSIAFPAISSGIFGFPIERCAEIMLNEAIQYLKSSEQIQEIYFCLWGAEAFNVFAKTLDR